MFPVIYTTLYVRMNKTYRDEWVHPLVTTNYILYFSWWYSREGFSWMEHCVPPKVINAPISSRCNSKFLITFWDTLVNHSKMKDVLLKTHIFFWLFMFVLTNFPKNMFTLTSKKFLFGQIYGPICVQRWADLKLSFPASWLALWFNMFRTGGKFYRGLLVRELRNGFCSIDD